MMNSFTDDVNPADYRISGNVQQPTQTVTNGVAGAVSWSNVETGVKSAEVTPLRYKDSEMNDGNQIVYTRRRSFIYRAHNRAFTPKMRYVIGSENYYITDIRNYKGRPHSKVMDCELMDNE